ncbi:unnamed protein product [Pieris macdunnoughi]|uniref:Uncharacterized protein n=1 Tax=Pieris macdunnoughi TaxID=345717 RepID=A0A821KY93_9NEOP|nr:unnamed protein product [Pieris macdunnoughi]
MAAQLLSRVLNAAVSPRRTCQGRAGDTRLAHLGDHSLGEASTEPTHFQLCRRLYQAPRVRGRRWNRYIRRAPAATVHAGSRDIHCARGRGVEDVTARLAYPIFFSPR